MFLSLSLWPWAPMPAAPCVHVYCGTRSCSAIAMYQLFDSYNFLLLLAMSPSLLQHLIDQVWLHKEKRFVFKALRRCSDIA